MVHLFQIARAVILRDHDGGAGADAHKQRAKHVDNREAGSDRRQCLVADDVADHDAVHHVVQLLEDVAQQHRQREADNQPVGAAAGHVDGRCSFFLCHKFLPLLKKYTFSPLCKKTKRDGG